MCLGELAQVVAVRAGGVPPVLEITDLDGRRPRRALALLDAPAAGDVVLVHSGDALHRLDEDAATAAAALRDGRSSTDVEAD